jgi:hypothetical protein
MMHRRFLLFALMLQFLATAIGCRDSAKSTQPAPAGSPPPVADAHKSPAVPVTPSAQLAVAGGKLPTNQVSPPDLSTLVPVKTFQVKLPASFNGDELPARAAVEFDVPGSTGQFLRVKVLGLYRVSVQPPSGGSALKAGGDTAGWLYALP